MHRSSAPHVAPRPARPARHFVGACILSTCLCALHGCATYQAAPLDGDDVLRVLTSPDHAALQIAARDLQHPALAPVALDFSKPFPPAAIAVLAVLGNPDLRALRARAQIAQAQVFAAGLLPDPTLSLTVDHALRPANTPTAYAGSLTLDLLGALATRAVDLRAARAANEQVRLDLAWQEWLTAGQAQLLATRLQYQQQAERYAKAGDQTARALAARLSAAVLTGDMRRDDLSLALGARADTTTRAIAAALAAEATRQELNRVLGLRPDEVVTLAPPAAAAPDAAPDALLQIGSADQEVARRFAFAQRNRLDLRALQAGYASSEASVQRAVLGQYPRLTIALNRARDNGRVQSIGPTVSLDVPLWNRNRGAIATTTAQRGAFAAEYAARLHATRAEIAALLAALAATEQGRAGLAQDLATIERTADALAVQARHGDATLTAADALQGVAIDKRIALIALQQSSAEQRLALGLAMGRPLDDTVGGQ